MVPERQARRSEGHVVHGDSIEKCRGCVAGTYDTMSDAAGDSAPRDEELHVLVLKTSQRGDGRGEPGLGHAAGGPGRRDLAVRCWQSAEIDKSPLNGPHVLD